MSLEAIVNIKKAEKQAEEISREAAIVAKNIIEKAQAEAHASVTNSVEQFGLETAQIIKNAEAQAQKDAEKIKQDIKNECAKIKQDANSNLEKAVDFVAKKISNTE